MQQPTEIALISGSSLMAPDCAKAPATFPANRQKLVHGLANSMAAQRLSAR